MKPGSERSRRLQPAPSGFRSGAPPARPAVHWCADKPVPPLGQAPLGLVRAFSLRLEIQVPTQRMETRGRPSCRPGTCEFRRSLLHPDLPNWGSCSPHLPCHVEGDAPTTGVPMKSSSTSSSASGSGLAVRLSKSYRVRDSRGDSMVHLRAVEGGVSPRARDRRCITSFRTWSALHAAAISWLSPRTSLTAMIRSPGSTLHSGCSRFHASARPPGFTLVTGRKS
mmetsp:Transcript_10346/g.26768  ORF Transcript_10346/g.26768 Transcript_10346/m.26768 type:complete len:224 (+) Transcript_10346:194-865(+)